VACWAYSFAVVFMRTRAIILERERDAQWVRELAAAPGGASVASSLKEKVSR
jgi:heme exporter protein C